MDRQEAAQTPGLKRRRRRDGTEALVWVCSDAARAAGFEPRTATLTALGSDPARLALACQRLAGEQRAFLGGTRAAVFDGTIGALLDRYETDPESSYHRLKPSSAHPYGVYLRRIRQTVGARAIVAVDGHDIARWHREWSSRGTPAAASMAISVLRAALAYGVVGKIPGCADLREAIAAARLPQPKPRSSTPDYAAVEALIAAAHRLGLPSIALATALQFEAALRLWDVIGQWLPLAAPEPSAVIHAGRKWIGPRWGDIASDWIVTIVPSKTVRTSGAAVTLDLSAMPLVMAEMARVPLDRRAGPLVVAERTGRPWRADVYAANFRKVRDAAGLPPTLWARDMRAGAITEGRRGGATIDDLAKQAGHRDSRTTARVYDRDSFLEASRRNAEARVRSRKRHGNDTGNA